MKPKVVHNADKTGMSVTGLLDFVFCYQ